MTKWPHIHWLKDHHHDFIDIVSGKTVFTATCRCGREFMVDTLFPIALFKVETPRSKRLRVIEEDIDANR